jgi:hypothetical protein
MKRTPKAFASRRVLRFGLGLVAASAAAAQLANKQLRAQIVGVWYCEVLRDTLHHNGGRLQYFPDGLFIADYRISSVASEQYVRTRGRWSVDHGVFTETADSVAGTDESIPKLARRVVAIDRQKMVLAPAAGDGPRFTIWRGKTTLDPSEHSMEATRKTLLAELEAMHMSGFRPNGPGPGPVSWRLDSRVVQDAIDNAKKK